VQFCPAISPALTTLNKVSLLIGSKKNKKGSYSIPQQLIQLLFFASCLRQKNTFDGLNIDVTVLIIGACTADSDVVFILKSYYIYSPNSESIINKAKRLATKKLTNSIISQVGIAFHFKKD
jgi:hypothetical protein